MAVLATPAVKLLPSHEQIPTQDNYISTFDYLSQYLPEVYEQEFSRYGDGRISTFLAQNAAEFPFESDMVKWTEKGRLHVKYVNCNADDAAATDVADFTINDTLSPGTGNVAVRKGQTVMIVDNGGTNSNKGVVTNVVANVITVAFYEGGGQTMALNATCTIWIYGSEFKKAAGAMEGSNVSQDEIFENTPIILKDSVQVAGSDLAQITWVYHEDEEGGESGYLWFLRSKSDTKKRFNDYLESSQLEAVPAEALSGAIGLTTGDYGNKGSEGVFYVVEDRGNVWGAGTPSTIADFDTIVTRLDKQGSIEENMIYVDRGFSFDIDDMLGALNSGYSGGVSYGLFDNSESMAVNLGFRGFHRGYDFYKNDWRYLNEETMRGSLAAGGISGLLIPAGSKSVYDQILGKNVNMPYIHTRYRKSQWTDRKYQVTITTSAQTRNDEMTVDFLSERVTCTLGANNFFLFQD